MHWLVALLFGVAVTQIAIFVTTIYLHRGLAHGALKFHPVLTLVFRSIIWITTGMKPREWAWARASAFMKANISTSPLCTSCVMQGIRPSAPNFGCRVAPSSISAVVVRAGNVGWLMAEVEWSRAGRAVATQSA